MTKRVRPGSTVNLTRPVHQSLTTEFLADRGIPFPKNATVVGLIQTDC